MDGSDNEDIGGVTGLMSVDSEFPSEEGGDTYTQEDGWIKRTFFSVSNAQLVHNLLFRSVYL